MADVARNPWEAGLEHQDPDRSAVDRPALDDAMRHGQAIHSETGGIPRKVNQLANRLMLHAALGGEGMIGAETVDAVVADLSADCAPAPARDNG